ncbi:MAG: DMT family transporter [Rubellimicrobium sp.]|nr:DMT family transporter [Rubellimicrobium sp.]
MTSQVSLTPRALGLVVLLGLIWGASYTATAVALDEVGVQTIVAIRTGGACLVLWAWILASGAPLPRRLADWAILLALGVIGNALPFTFITWGQMTVPSGLAAILNAATAIFGVLIAAIFFRDERLTRQRVLGVAIGLTGVITALGPAQLLALDLTSLAQLALVAAGLCYGATGALGRVALRSVAPQVAATGMMTGAALTLVPLALLTEGLPEAHFTGHVWLALVYSAVIATAVAYLIYYRLIATAGAGNAGFVTLLVAPVSIVLGAIMLHESLPLRAYAGFALLAVALVVLDGRLPRRLLGRPAGVAGGGRP